MTWLHLFDERQRKQIEFCRLYDSADFRHGADSHNNMLIIAKFARSLEFIEWILHTSPATSSAEEKVASLLEFLEGHKKE